MEVRILLCPLRIFGVMVAQLSPKQLVEVRVLEDMQVKDYEKGKRMA